MSDINGREPMLSGAMPEQEFPPVDATITYGQMFDLCVACKTEAEADRVMVWQVANHMHHNPGMSEQEATGRVRYNIGYFTGYYDDETAERVKKLFRLRHPIFG